MIVVPFTSSGLSLFIFLLLSWVVSPLIYCIRMFFCILLQCFCLILVVLWARNIAANVTSFVLIMKEVVFFYWKKNLKTKPWKLIFGNRMCFFTLMSSKLNCIHFKIWKLTPICAFHLTTIINIICINLMKLVKVNMKSNVNA